MPPIFSYSRLETFKQCPRKYAFQYIEKPDVEKLETVEAYLGTVCHETVQQIYRDLLLSKRMTLEDTLALYDTLWEKEKPLNLRINRERYSEENYKDTGRGYVRDFYLAKQPFEDGRTIGIEKQVQVEIGPGILLTGFIDRLVDHGGGRYEIVDYKTNRDLPSPQELRESWQLPLYQIGLMQLLPDLKEVACTWHFLAHNKAVSIRKSAEELEDVKSAVTRLVRQIEATAEFETRVSALCSWCDFEAVCPGRKHFIATESLQPEEFIKEDGVKLVDEYIYLEQVLSETKAKLERLREKIFAFARLKDLVQVRGGEYKIRIWTKNGAVKVQAKEENAEVDRQVLLILKKHGLAARFVRLAAWDLTKAIESGEIPAHVVAELSPYLKKEDIWRIYPSKIKEWE